MKRIFVSFVALVACAFAFPQNQPVRPSITGITYARIASSDLKRSRDFYVKNLGFEDLMGDCFSPNVPCLPVNLFQNIEVEKFDQSPALGLVMAVAFSTSDSAGLQHYLEAHGVHTDTIANKVSSQFDVIDPEGHRIVFVQLPHTRGAAWSQFQEQISARIIHAGFVVHDRAAEDHLYKDILGFHVYWHGGMKDDETNWVDMQVPDGTDWIEYMLNVPANADKHTLGVMNHIALGVPDIHAAEKQLHANGWNGTEQPKIGRDGKWQLNLYDPDDTRVEFMEFTPVQKPCCSEFTGPHPGPQSTSKAPAKP